MQTVWERYPWLKDGRRLSLERASKTRKRFARELTALGLARGTAEAELVTEEDLAPLPAAVQRYLRFMRVTGKPRDWSFRAGWSGHFRRGPDDPWIPCEAWQYDSAIDVARIFHMGLALGNVLPTIVRDTYVNGRGHMLAKVLDVFKVADASGYELDLGELVTYLNDAIFYAPSMLLRPCAQWLPVGESSFDVKLADGGHMVTARVLVDARGAPYDFSTTDRFVNDPYRKGKPLVQALWTTPVDDWMTREGHPVPCRGKAIWHLPGGTFEYARFRLLDGGLSYNVDPRAGTGKLQHKLRASDRRT